MTQIVINPDCGNAPRKLFLKKLYTAVAKGDETFLQETISDNLKWQIAGKKIIEGKSKYLVKIKKMAYWNPAKLIIETIITHGAEAAVSGTTINPDGKQLLFCDIYRFKSAGSFDILSITTFLIKR